MLNLASRKSTIDMSQMRRFAYADGTSFYLSKGVVTEEGKPRVSISRWSIDAAYRELERANRIPEGSLRPEKLYESHRASSQDPEAHNTTFSAPAKWLLHL